mgnify:CR=1 FL=1
MSRHASATLGSRLLNAAASHEVKNNVTKLLSWTNSRDDGLMKNFEESKKKIESCRT